MTIEELEAALALMTFDYDATPTVEYIDVFIAGAFRPVYNCAWEIIEHTSEDEKDVVKMLCLVEIRGNKARNPICLAPSSVLAVRVSGGYGDD